MPCRAEPQATNAKVLVIGVVVHVADEVHGVLERLELVRIGGGRGKHSGLSFDRADNALVVGAVALCFVLATGVTR